MTATYSLNDDNVLQLVIEATTDKTTPVNLAQHSYFNLNGQARDNVLNHVVYIKGCVPLFSLLQMPWDESSSTVSVNGYFDKSGCD